jgi:hypothetical protein
LDEKRAGTAEAVIGFMKRWSRAKALSAGGRPSLILKGRNMRLIRYSLLALVVAAAFTGCKKGGGGGYVRTAPSAAIAK